MSSKFTYFFRSLGGNRRYNKDGIVMKRTGRDEYEYSEGDRKTLIYAEMQVGNPSTIIDAVGIQQWLPPHENEPLTDDDRRRIVQNVCRFLEYYGHTYRVQE